MTADDQEAGRTRYRPTYSYLRRGPALLVVALFVLALVVTVTLLEPIPADVASVSRGLALALVLIGVIITVVYHVAVRAVESLKATAAGSRKTEEALSAQLADHTRQIGYLMAAPTVNLNELKRDMASAGTATADVLEEIKKEVHALADRLDRLLASGDQMADAPGNVVAMPNPAIYQLGIAEGERRAREGREKMK